MHEFTEAETAWLDETLARATTPTTNQLDTLRTHFSAAAHAEAQPAA